MPRNPAASHLSTPVCISQGAVVWRNVRAVTQQSSPACATALLNAVFTDNPIGSPFYSTIKLRTMRLSRQRRRRVNSRGMMKTRVASSELHGGFRSADRIAVVET